MTFGISFAAVPRPVLAAIVLAVSLSGALVVYGRIASPHQTVIAFHAIQALPGGGSSKPANLVINDNDTWVKVWTGAYWGQTYCLQPLPNGGSPCEPAPFVNFTTRTVIGVFMGVQPGPLYTIKITQIVRSDSNTIVHMLRTEAGNCGEAAIETSPYHAVNIPKTEDHITFAAQTFIMHC